MFLVKASSSLGSVMNTAVSNLSGSVQVRESL